MPVTDRSLTPEMIKENQALVGKPVDRTRQWWNTVASKDAIRHFVWGLGDDNPLWLDEQYANASVIGHLSAPGTFLYSIDSTIVFPGLEGLARLFAGNEWEWFERVNVDDTFTAKAEFTEAREVTGKKGGHMVLQVGETDYWNQNGVRVAHAVHYCLRTERVGAGGKLNYAPRTYEYSGRELKAIQDAVMAESVRGGEPRYVDDVAVGDVIGPLVKGPLTLTDMICWYGGNGPHGRRPHRMAWKELVANSDFYYESSSAGYEFSERGHYDAAMAAELGMPGPYDNGLQRTSWLAHLLTDWMGDEGFLRTLTSRALLPNVFGDTTWINATVTERGNLDDVTGFVDVAITGHNQLGDLSTSGTARVHLPRR
jgi:acyl dehydratase